MIDKNAITTGDAGGNRSNFAIMNVAEIFLAWRIYAMARRALPWHATEIARFHADVLAHLARGTLVDLDLAVGPYTWDRNDPDETMPLPPPSAVPGWMQEE